MHEEKLDSLKELLSEIGKKINESNKKASLNDIYNEIGINISSDKGSLSEKDFQLS